MKNIAKNKQIRARIPQAMANTIELETDKMNVATANNTKKMSSAIMANILPVDFADSSVLPIYGLYRQETIKSSIKPTARSVGF